MSSLTFRSLIHFEFIFHRFNLCVVVLFMTSDTGLPFLIVLYSFCF